MTLVTALTRLLDLEWGGPSKAGCDPKSVAFSMLKSVAFSMPIDIRELKRELRRVKLERDILAKATAWFAREGGSIPKRGSDS